MATAYLHALPTFLKFGTPVEVAMVNDVQDEVKNTARELGADYVYVAKNKTGNARPLTFAFYAEGGKFLARRTINTVVG